MNEPVTRDRIILHMKNALEKIPFIHACWLEGADANRTVDEYSDLDFWVDFDDAYD